MNPGFKLCCVILLTVFANSLRAEAITIAGTGASQTLLREMAAAFDAQNAGCITHIPDSVGSRGGIRALLAGKADLARTSRALRERESALGLHYIQFATTSVVFATHPSVGVEHALSLSQIADIYAGRIDNWQQLGGPNHKIFPLTRDGGTTLRTVSQQIAGLDESTRYAKATFSSLETLKLLKQHPYTIGFLPHTLTAGTPLRVLTLKADHTKSALAGAERESTGVPMPLALGLVYRQRQKRCAAMFIAFVTSPRAVDAIRRNNAMPFRPVQE